MASLNEMLDTRYVARQVNQETGISSALLRFFGFDSVVADPDLLQGQEQGRNVRRVDLRTVVVDVFNDARTASGFTAPGRQPSIIERQTMGQYAITIPRVYEAVQHPLEDVVGRRPIGGQYNQIDPAGRDFLRKQWRFLAQRAVNNRMLQLAAYMRGGKLYGHKLGDTMYLDFTSSSAQLTLDWQYPSGNLSSLNMTGAGNIIGALWSTDTTDIPGQLFAIDAAFASICGSALEVMVMNGVTWNYVLQNTKVRALAGTSNQPGAWVENGPEENTLFGGHRLKIGRINGFPDLQIIITNHGLKVGAPGSEAFVPFMPDGKVWFGPRPNADLLEGLVYGEPVIDTINGQPTPRYGLFAHGMQTPFVGSITQAVLDNFYIANHVPNAAAYGTVA